ncbi:hypothetical protein HanXRQr2_Chr05g0213211 [Helianthus annuus]|uniref:Uncharacterized protein n=1 Tax=Helianthus annuus TaxID=4232 RepID=A0A9K3IZI7_HELAN|nr:hypothetical protein HanXRQr2_Chr05g0213211 [Helianthus annuus]
MVRIRLGFIKDVEMCLVKSPCITLLTNTKNESTKCSGVIFSNINPRLNDQLETI